MHDKNGTQLAKGDRVLVELVIKDVSANADACNVTLGTIEPLPPGGVVNSFVINTKQTLLLAKAALLLLVLLLTASDASAIGRRRAKSSTCSTGTCPAAATTYTHAGTPTHYSPPTVILPASYTVNQCPGGVCKPAK